MNHFLRGVARAVTDTFPFPEPILEVGSLKVAGQENLADLRSFFPGKEYLGVDIRPGLGVDMVANVENLPFPDGCFGTVIAMSTFEHVQRFWRGFEEIHRVLRPEGVLLVSCPFHVRIHNHPSDYWRFTPEAFEVLLANYPQKILGWHGPGENPENVWAVAFREKAPAISNANFQAYRQRVKEFARQPIPWKRKLRYRLFNWLDRRGLCDHFLKVENWDSTYHREPNPTKQPSLASSST